MSLIASFTVSDRDVSVDLAVENQATLAIIGPNGSGKSTVLQVLSGLLRADRGTAAVDARILFDQQTWLAPHQRRLALLAQQPRLFPRMTALGNVEFALRARRADRHQAMDWLERVAAGDLAHRRPATLSGGQAQRVAIARALAADPDVLLLDEPLAALDPSVAAEIRHTLRPILAARTTVLVTHEVLDAALLADDLLVMQGGRVVECGTTTTVMSNPRTDFAAQMCGLNLVRGVAAGPDTLASNVGTLTGLGSLRAGQQAVAAFAPAAVGVYRHPPHGSPRNVVPARITRLTPHGQVVRVGTDAFAADLTPGAVAELGLHPDLAVFLAVKAAEIQLYAA